MLQNVSLFFGGFLGGKIDTSKNDRIRYLGILYNADHLALSGVLTCPFFHQESASTYFSIATTKLPPLIIDNRYCHYSAALSIAESMKMKSLKIV